MAQQIILMEQLSSVNSGDITTVPHYYVEQLCTFIRDPALPTIGLESDTENIGVGQICLVCSV